MVKEHLKLHRHDLLSFQEIARFQNLGCNLTVINQRPEFPERHCPPASFMSPCHVVVFPAKKNVTQTSFNSQRQWYSTHPHYTHYTCPSTKSSLQVCECSDTFGSSTPELVTAGRLALRGAEVMMGKRSWQSTNGFSRILRVCSLW